ncbi:HAMP domain protein, partial [Vibrio parahaemolyticus V-223/04]
KPKPSEKTKCRSWLRM